MSCVKIIYIFKTENAITLKTCTEVYFLRDLLLDRYKTLKVLAILEFGFL